MRSSSPFRAAEPWHRRLLPNSLFARALMIVVLPMLLVQGTSTYLFYARHWDNVARYFAGSVAGEIAFVTHEWQQAAPATREALARASSDRLGIALKWRAVPTGQGAPAVGPSGLEDSLLEDVVRQLEGRMRHPFWVERLPDPSMVRIVVVLPNHELSYLVPKKRLISQTLEVWLVGNALVMLLAVLLAVLFLRNQVRPIVALARAADRFGRGQDMPGFHPHGAREVRLASHAFLTMKERIRRMLQSRTDMLAAISHDLRTPLTRMKLQLELLSDSVAKGRLQADVQLMEGMIQEYLDFVRSDVPEAAVPTALRPMIEAVIATHTAAGAQVALHAPQDLVVPLRARAFQRAVTNLLDNALRYGSECRVALQISPSLISIHVEDNGVGIPEAERERMFLPFHRGDAARGLHEGGAGLGLSIVREVVHQHGGRVHLSHSESLGGLCATITLPR